jgi:23S rRNA (cytidine1920-2'-O)/16S rRNA (cytidine1409-2'-O)-methyltransferase
VNALARRRLDAELVRRGLVASRTEAQSAVRDGLVLVSGRPAEKPSTLVDPADPVELVAPARRFVSRGGDKLAAALDRFGVESTGRRALDAGASTGGFTDRLLQGGAAHVVALDVGYGQLAWSLRTDERVSVLERTNVRELTPAHLPYAPDLVVADLSFISLRLALPALARVAEHGADFVLLVKPQFEAGPEQVGRGGVIRDPEVWRRVVADVASSSVEAGLSPRGAMASPLPGPAGNVEFFLHAVKDAGSGGEGEAALPDGVLDHAVSEGRRIGGAT